MKKFLGIFLVALLSVCLSSCGIGISGKNVTGITGNEAMVWYNAKCPYCNHVNPTSSLNLSEGEEYEGTAICRNNDCCKAFDISIKR